MLDSFDKLKKRLMYYIGVVVIFGFAIFGLRGNNQFYGLNESSDVIDCIYYASIVFSGSTYGEIHPQTLVARIIIFVLSVIKLIIILYPFENFPVDNFQVANTYVTAADVEEIINDISKYNVGNYISED